MITPVRGSPLWISPTLGKINRIHSSRILEDPEGKLTIDEVVQFPWAGRFTPQGDSGNNLGMTRSAFWIRLNLEFSGAYPGRYLLEVPYPPLDELTAYLPDGEGGMRVIETGDRKPFSHRDVVVLASGHRAANRILRPVVIQWHLRILQEQGESRPMVEQALVDLALLLAQ